MKRILCLVMSLLAVLAIAQGNPQLVNAVNSGTGPGSLTSGSYATIHNAAGNPVNIQFQTSSTGLATGLHVYISTDGTSNWLQLADAAIYRYSTNTYGAVAGAAADTWIVSSPFVFRDAFVVNGGGAGSTRVTMWLSPYGVVGQTTATTGPVVTANAGTNLNTSPLALETGGNLATIATNTTGVATSAKQDTGNTSLASILANTVTLLTQLGTIPYDSSSIIKANLQMIYESDPTFTLGQTQSGGRMDSKGTLLVNPGALSNTTDSVAIGDGTNIAKVTAGDINAVGVGSGSLTGTLTLTGSQSANAALVDPVTTLAYVDMKGYSALTVHTTGLGTSATSVAFFGSNDASHWVSTGALNNNYSTGGSQATTSSTTSGFTLMGGYRYYQIQITGSQSAGTTTVAYNLKGTSPVTAYSTAFAPTVGTTGGITNVYNNSALSNSALGVKTSGAGNVYAYTFHNPDATNDATILLYNIAYGSVTVGTSTPIFYITLAPGASANMAFPFPLTCGTQISIAAVKGDSISGTSAPNTAIQAWVGYN